jgi:hypothetical protein
MSALGHKQTFSQVMFYVRFTLSRNTKQDHTDNRYDPRKVGPATITGVSPGRTPHAH